MASRDRLNLRRQGVRRGKSGGGNLVMGSIELICAIVEIVFDTKSKRLVWCVCLVVSVDQESAADSAP
jgi:hypothetical protein